MARLPYPDPESIPPAVAQALEPAAQHNIFRMLPYAETQVHGFLRMGAANFQELALDNRLREIAILATARTTNANYEWAHHVTIGGRAGITPEDIAAIKRGDFAALAEPDRIVATFAAEVTSDVRASDETFAAAHKLLGNRQVVELLLVVGYYNMVARFLETLDVDLEPKYVDRLR